MLIEYYGNLEAVLVRFFVRGVWNVRRIGVNDEWWNDLHDEERQRYRKILSENSCELDITPWVAHSRVGIIFEGWAVDEYKTTADKKKPWNTDITFGSHGGG